MKNVRIRTKLFLAVLALAAVAMAGAGVLAYVWGRFEFQRATFDHLTSVRAGKADQIESYFRRMQGQARTLSADRMIVDAIREFSESFRRLQRDGVAREQRDAVTDYYARDLLTALEAHANGQVATETMVPADDATLRLQHVYIVENPHPLGEKDLLDDASDGSNYSVTHHLYHPVLRDFVHEFGFYDLFLIDADGNVVYSVSKEIDFANSLVDGPHRASNLAAAFVAARDAPSGDSVVLVDFVRYAPSYFAPASFMATPIDDGGRRLGVLAFQVPIAEIDRIMTRDGNWDVDGLGETGESYIVGRDFTMRSSSRFLLENPSGYLAAAEKAGVPPAVLRDIRDFQTTILLQEVRTEASRFALSGDAATRILRDYRDVAVLSSYAPLEIEGVQWAVITEIDVAEAFAPVHSFVRNLVLGLAGLLLIVLAASWIMARRIVAPIVALERASQRFAAGDLDVKVEVSGGDELGRLSNSFNEMVASIHQQTDALKRSKNLLERTLESLTYPFYVIDAQDYSIKMANSAATKLGLSGESTCHALTHKRATPCDGKDDPCPLIEVKKTRKPVSFEHVHFDAEGKRSFVEVHGYPIFDDEGNLVQMIEYSLDITERKAMELQLREAKETADSANRAKSTFLANMSHELRTPMNAIIGYSEMLTEDAEDEGHDAMVPDLKKINVAGKHLLALINDILDLAKIEAGRMDLYLERFDLRQVLDEAVATVAPLVAKNDNRLVTDFGDDLGAVRADLTKLRQALFNLLSNASKFTEGGTVTLVARRNPGDHGDRITLSVSDTGIGIAEDKLDRVFEEFMQADDSTTRDFGGTGLGLPISRRFCRMMGGDITVTSRPGEGSTFTIEIPAKVDALKAAKASVRAETPAPVQIRPGVRPILVIDDDSDSRELLERTLEGEGYEVVTAVSGEEGLELARTVEPCLITLDVMMPGMDGWAVLERLKGDPDLRDIPVMIVSIMGERDLGFTLGAVEYLTKPVDRDMLRRVVKLYTGEKKGGHALVVDDDSSIRTLFRRALEEGGWTVDEAENGSLALDRVAERVPDLVLLDLMMPVMDGFEFVMHFRRREDCSSVPIIVVTSKDLTGEDRRRLVGGVEKIVEKGALTREQLLGEVRDLVARHGVPTHNGGPQGASGAATESERE